MSSSEVRPDRIRHDPEFEHRTLDQLARAFHIAVLDDIDEFDDFGDVLLLAEIASSKEDS